MTLKEILTPPNSSKLVPVALQRAAYTNEKYGWLDDSCLFLKHWKPYWPVMNTWLFQYMCTVGGCLLNYIYEHFLKLFINSSDKLFLFVCHTFFSPIKHKIWNDLSHMGVALVIYTRIKMNHWTVILVHSIQCKYYMDHVEKDIQHLPYCNCVHFFWSFVICYSNHCFSSSNSHCDSM